MSDRNRYEADLNRIHATRHHNGGDFWATADGRIGIEKPISTLSALLIMSELKVPKSHEALQGAAELVLQAIRDDGRVRIAPKGAIYPCHTAQTVRGNISGQNLLIFTIHFNFPRLTTKRGV